MGYTQAKNDKCLYVHGRTRHSVGAHVDDCITRGSKIQTEVFWAEAAERFELKGWGIVEPGQSRTYLSRRICCEVRAGVQWYSMDQERDIADFLEEEGMTVVRTVGAPMASITELMENRVELDRETAAKVRSQIGSMSYFATKTRPDIACEVNLVAQDMKTPRTGTAKAVKRIMAYLSSTVDRRLWVPRVTGNEWECYSDSDHAGNRSHGDYKSRTGVLILLNGMPIHWRSNKQPVTAMSSAAAEVVALSDTMKDMRLRIWVAEEANIEVKRPITVLVDNKAAKSFQEGTNPESKLQGVFDMRWEWVKELKNAKEFTVKHVTTDKNLADALTKPVTVAVRKTLNEELNRILQKVASKPAGVGRGHRGG